MAPLPATLLDRSASDPITPVGSRIGRIVSVRQPDEIRVDFEGNPYGPLVAKSTIAILQEHENRQAVLIFDRSDVQRPVIVGLIQAQPVSEENALASLNRKDIVDIFVDGEKLVMEAKREIEIRCGKSALIMKPDGKVVIKGEDLVSRARRTNKIKGATVRIN